MRRIALFLLCLGLAGCIISFKDEKAKKNLVDTRIHYLYPYNDEASTMLETFYKKETAPHHYAETTLSLEPGQQLLILNRALTLKFFQMPDTLRPHGTVAASEPGKQFLRIKADSLDHTVTWTGSLANYQHSRLPELVAYVDSIVKSTDQYQALPPSQLQR